MRSVVQIAGQRGLLYLSPGWDTTPEEITAAVKPKKKKKKIHGQDRIWSPSWSLIRFIASNSSSVALQWWASSPDCLAATNPSSANRTARRISPVPSYSLLLKFRIPPKSKDRHRNSSLFRWIRRTNRRNKEADQLMSWSEIAPLYGHFGTDWAAMEATAAARSSNSSCNSTRPISSSGLSPRRAESPPHPQTILLRGVHSNQ